MEVISNRSFFVHCYKAVLSKSASSPNRARGESSTDIKSSFTEEALCYDGWQVRVPHMSVADDSARMPGFLSQCYRINYTPRLNPEPGSAVHSAVRPCNAPKRQPGGDCVLYKDEVLHFPTLPQVLDFDHALESLYCKVGLVGVVNTGKSWSIGVLGLVRKPSERAMLVCMGT